MTTINLQGQPIEISGVLPKIGSKAPDFTVTKTDLSEIHLKNVLGKTIILNIFPSLDTPTCASAAHHFNEIAKTFPNVLILCVSADLPFAQKRFVTAEHLVSNIQPVSVFRHPGFGKDYGVDILNGPLKGLLSRAVVIVNDKGTITYTQQVHEMSEEPDYAAIKKALKQV